MPNINEVLTQENFKNWLRDHKDDTFNRQDSGSCPIATYLTNKGFTEVSVDPCEINVLNVLDKGDDDLLFEDIYISTSQPNFNWVRKFVNKVDDFPIYHGPDNEKFNHQFKIDGRQSLQILKSLNNVES